MKLLVSLNSKKIEDYLDYTNSFIIGLKDFSINYLELSLDEIKELLLKYPKIELFVSINKNIFNNELDSLKECLIFLNNLNIKGIMFYDLAVLSYYKKLGLSIPLVWHQTHMVTNYNTCNYYYDKGVSYAYLSSEITLQEMIEIKEKTKIKLIGYILGHTIVSHSRRNLLSTYFENYQRKMDNDTYKIKGVNDDKEYFIREKNHGTSILYGNILNGLSYIFSLENILDYSVLDEKLIEHDIFMKILSNTKKYLDTKDNKYLDNVIKLIGNDTGFFEKKTIYKVKKDEKN